MSYLLRYGLIAGSCVIALLITAILVIKFKKKNNKLECEFPKLLEALGGSNNINNITLNGSRISMNFDSKKNIDKELIKCCGVETIVISNKKITLVVGKHANQIYNYLKRKEA